MAYFDAEAFKRKLIDEKSFFPAIVARALEEMTPADVVEVPCRCGDCKYAQKHYRVNHLIDGWWHTEGEYELLYITCDNSNREKLSENDFCSYGERS